MSAVNITLSKVSKSFGSRILFENVNVTFNAGDRYGLTGPNGAGKSTLFRIIMGLEPPTEGIVSLPDRVGILRQNIEDFLDCQVLDVVLMGNQRLWDALTERNALYEQEMTDEVGMRLGELEGTIAEEDGYAAEANAEILLAGIGLEEDMFLKRMHEIPTDLQFRVLVCQALFGDPQALLLDEPTNHLDMDSIGWLENFLHGYKGVVVVVSHDRHFLNSVTTRIADIDYETIIVYPGNYDDMIAAKTSVRERAESEAKSKDVKIAKLKEFVARFSAGTRASQVQSRMREMERLQPQELKASNIQRPYIRFIPQEKPSGKIVLKVEHLSKRYDSLQVIKDFSLEIHKGDRIGVIGNNGRGKTTLIRMLASVLQPDEGQVERGHQVAVSYFPQNHGELVDKSDRTTLFEWLRKRKQGVYDQDVRSVLGKMLFTGDDAFKEVCNLSGGETARLILAGILLENHNFLIMDEPNNHLDLEAVSALGWGLANYPGTVLFVSHDRDLVSTAATKIIAFEKDGIHLHDGGLEDYLSRRQPQTVR